MMAKYVIGLTGGIAAGKTAAAEYLKKLGACVVDADEIARHTGEREILAAFPDCADAGRLDRRRLRQRVFADPPALAKLDSITHPLIIKAIEARLAAESQVVVLVAPLLYETGLDRRCDYVLNISAPPDLRIKRLQKRDNIGKELAYNMLKAQTNEQERQNKADLTISNDGDEKALERKIGEWWTRLLEKVG